MSNRARDLAAAFADAPSARTAALAPLPPPPTAARPRPVPVPPPEPPLEPDSTADTQKGMTNRATRTAETPPPRAGADAATTGAAPGTTVVYVTPAVREAMRRRVQHGRGLTFTDLVLDALEAQESHLRTRWVTAPSTGRFQRSQPRRPRRDEPGVQVALRLTSNNLAALDAMVSELNAPSRTTLVEEALRQYLADELPPVRP